MKSRVRRGILLTSAYLVITLIMSYPLILHFRSFFIGGPADGSMSFWSLWWMKYALVDLGQNPLDCSYLFYPEGVNLVYHSLPKALGLLSIPFQLLLGLTAGHNLVVIATFVGTALITYWLACRLVGRRTPAFIAGAIFAFCSYRWGQVGHLTLLSTMLIPLYAGLMFICKEKASWANRRNWLFFVLAGLVLGVMAYDTEYYSVFLVIFNVVFCAFYFPFKNYREKINQWLAMIAGFGLTFAVAGIVYAPMFLAAQKELAANGDYISFPLSLTAMYGADLMAFIVPAGTSEFFGKAFPETVKNFSVAETSFIGWTALLLASAGVVFNYRCRQVWMWMFSAVFFAACALGPYLVVQGDNYAVPTPYLLLAKIPLIQSVRAPSRFIVITMLAIAILAAYGIRGIIERLEKKERMRYAVPVVVVAIMLMLGIEYKAPTSLVSTKTPPVYEEIGASGGSGSIITMPLGWSTGVQYMGQEATFTEIYQAEHRRPLVSGMVARAPRKKVMQGIYRPVLDNLANIYMGPSSLDMDSGAIKMVLDEYQVSYIVVHKTYPEIYSSGIFVTPATVIDQAALKRIDEYATVYLGMEKFEESPETVAYRRK